ncbi:J domain-containing protein [Halovivax cerinus]|uniref:J domain-containing protein n=1 Tax=Halovivax cerinus TaxID=1487865 RepID=A0ABD5NT38_9EURY|nr:J domain-containing protein [Halovivax cerinus]
MTEDFYDLLDVPPDATQDEIKAAFREQVRIYHPDLNDDERAQAQFTALKTAYDVLGDPVERRAYDRLGHVDYVAKRTSGLPSPDKWATDDADGSSSVGDSTVRTESTSWGSSAGADARTGDASASSTGSGRGSGSNVGSSAGIGSSTGIGRRVVRSPHDRLSELLRWWRSINVAGPLLWTGTLVYLLGLIQYGRANSDAFGDIWETLRTSGVDYDALVSASDGLTGAISYVGATEPVTPPIARQLWYAVLAGAIVGTIALLLGWRHTRRGSLLGPVTIDETILLALVVGVTSTLAGGVLLAGSLLLPLLFGVVIYHSRRLPGWSPSYVYLLLVSAPVAVLVAGTIELAFGPIELVALVVVPLLGALGLPVRIVVRRRIGV